MLDIKVNILLVSGNVVLTLIPWRLVAGELKGTGKIVPSVCHPHNIEKVYVSYSRGSVVFTY